MGMGPVCFECVAVDHERKIQERATVTSPPRWPLQANGALGGRVLHAGHGRGGGPWREDGAQKLALRRAGLALGGLLLAHPLQCSEVGAGVKFVLTPPCVCYRNSH